MLPSIPTCHVRGGSINLDSSQLSLTLRNAAVGRDVFEQGLGSIVRCQRGRHRHYCTGQYPGRVTTRLFPLQHCVVWRVCCRVFRDSQPWHLFSSYKAYQSSGLHDQACDGDKKPLSLEQAKYHFTKFFCWFSSSKKVTCTCTGVWLTSQLPVVCISIRPTSTLCESIAESRTNFDKK